MKRLAREKLLCDLTLELETVSAAFSHGLSSFESPAARSIAKLNPVRPKGPTPRPSQFDTILDVEHALQARNQGAEDRK